MKKTEAGVNMYLQNITFRYIDPDYHTHLDYDVWLTTHRNGGMESLGEWSGQGYTTSSISDPIKLEE